MVARAPGIAKEAGCDRVPQSASSVVSARRGMSATCARLKSNCCEPDSKYERKCDVIRAAYHNRKHSVRMLGRGNVGDRHMAEVTHRDGEEGWRSRAAR